MAYLKFTVFIALFGSTLIGASPMVTEDIEERAPKNLARDGGFEQAKGSPWGYTGTTARRRTGVGAVSGIGYAEIAIPKQNGDYPKIAQDITLPQTGFYTLNYAYTVAKKFDSRGCLLQTGVGNSSFVTVPLETAEVGTTYSTGEAHYAKKGTYPGGLSFFLYCDNRPGITVNLDNVAVTYSHP